MPTSPHRLPNFETSDPTVGQQRVAELLRRQEAALGELDQLNDRVLAFLDEVTGASPEAESDTEPPEDAVADRILEFQSDPAAANPDPGESTSRAA